jgi:hypothetical protein
MDSPQAHAVLFEDDDPGYMAWLAAHPEGYVANARKARTPDYYFLHTSVCHHIAQRQPQHAANGFTGTDYIKVCSDSIQALRQWGQAKLGIVDFTGRCDTCGP